MRNTGTAGKVQMLEMNRQRAAIRERGEKRKDDLMKMYIPFCQQKRRGEIWTDWTEWF